MAGGTGKDMAVEPMNLDTGEVDPSGALIRPADVHATVLESMGLDHGHLANQSPQIIRAVLRDG